MEKVGMIGVGAMGAALLERLKLAGVQATVYDAHAPSLQEARSLGAKIAASAAEVANESTLIDVVVRTDQEALTCVIGHDGILEGAHAGTLVLLHSTILPQTSRQVEEAAHKKAVFVIDACMAGVPATVRAGNLTFLVGGPDELVARAKPHLLKMGKQVLHMGPLGTGNVAKLIRNMVSGAETLIVQEALQIGIAGGIPYPAALEMMRQVDSEGVLSRWQKTFDPSGQNPIPRSGRNVLNKDIPLAAELARHYGLNLPLTEQLDLAAQKVVKANEAK